MKGVVVVVVTPMPLNDVVDGALLKFRSHRVGVTFIAFNNAPESLFVHGQGPHAFDRYFDRPLTLVQ